MNFLFYAPQMASYGGMEYHVCSLAAACSERGHLVTLLTTSNSLGANLRSLLSGSRVRLSELNCSRGAAGPIRKAVWLCRESLRARGTKWDSIYTNGQSSLARLPWLAASTGTRVVHHHHTAADAREQETWTRGFRKVLIDAPELVACSRATQEALVRACGRKNVRFLPYLTACSIKTEEVTDRTYEPNSKLNFGFFGRLVPEKGIEMMCRLSQCPQLARVTWHIHGAGEAYTPDYFRAFPNVMYHGSYSCAAEQKERLLASDALVLFSSHNEGMPLSLIEGMSAGLPWIATDRGGTSEIGKSPADCIVVPPSAEMSEVAAATYRLVQRLDRGETSRTRQREAYDRNFSPEVVSALWFQLLEGRSELPLSSGASADILAPSCP